MDKKLIIGIGTGRCGTTTLAAILNAQPDTEVSHEFPVGDPLPWAVDDELVFNRMDAISNRSAKYIGDVASYFLPYVEQIVDFFLMEENERNYEDMKEAKSGCKIIVLKRKPADVVRSFINWTKGSNHWQPGTAAPNKYDKAFPNCPIPSASKEQAIMWYCQEYERRVKAMIQKLPEVFFRIDLAGLNDESRVREMLSWIGYSDDEMRVMTGVKLNKGNYAKG